MGIFGGGKKSGTNSGTGAAGGSGSGETNGELTRNRRGNPGGKTDARDARNKELESHHGKSDSEILSDLEKGK